MAGEGIHLGPTQRFHKRQSSKYSYEQVLLLDYEAWGWRMFAEFKPGGQGVGNGKYKAIENWDSVVGLLSRVGPQYLVTQSIKSQNDRNSSQ